MEQTEGGFIEVLEYSDVKEVLEKGPQMVRTRSGQELWRQYLECRRDLYGQLFPQERDSSMLSEANWMMRRNFSCGDAIGIRPRRGDICYMDFGQSAYLNEAGYFHFGLVMSLCQKKALVIPMTSNAVQYQNALSADNPDGRRHLMRIGQVPGMHKPSVLFLNDMKYVNTARIICIRAHIDEDSRLFRQIRRRMVEVLQD
jgi:hypothetical protein